MGRKRKKTMTPPSKRRKSKPGGGPITEATGETHLNAIVVVNDESAHRGAGSEAIDDGRPVVDREGEGGEDNDDSADESGDSAHKSNDSSESDPQDDCAVAGDADAAEVNDEISNDDGSVNSADAEYFASVAEEIDRDFRDRLMNEAYGASNEADSGDDVWDDERIPDPYSSDDDEEEQPGRTYKENDCNLWLGKTFSNAEEFKNTILRYSLKTRYDVKYYLSSELKLGLKCNDKRKKCQWRVYCSYERRKRKLMIKCLNNKHTCLKSTRVNLLRASSIAYLFKERLRLDPKMTRHQMKAEIAREYSLTVTKDQCAKAKTLVTNERKQTHKEHFGKIWDYQAEVLHRNPGTTFDIETMPGPTIGSTQKFFRLYICFDSQRECWKRTCRPIIGVDGAFLKWDIKGQLLAAVGRDGDNRIVPIAWAVVEVENEINWVWFMRHLCRDLGLNDGRDIAILSDKQNVSHLPCVFITVL